jgi:hypothetical protein
MVFAVQCPNPRCHKFMLVEEHDCNNVVSCLLCKTPIRVGPPPASRLTGPDREAMSGAPPGVRKP